MSQDDKSLMLSACQRFSLLGHITSKTLFGGFGLYQERIMFALIAEEKLYLRGGGSLEELLRNRGLDNFIYTKRGRPVVLRYYRIDEELWNNEPLLLRYAKQALAGAQQDKQQQVEARCQRIKDLPNLGLTSERLLRRVGIENSEDLRSLGAVRAYLRIKTYSQGISLNFLWALAGALAGCHATILPNDARQALLESLQNIK